MMRFRGVLPIVAVLAACHGQPNQPQGNQADGKAAASAPAEEDIIPVEWGKRPPNTPMTSANMPLFDTVTYCILSTRKTDTIVMGPLYESCIEHQDQVRIVIAAAIDANKFAEAVINRCAKDSRTAYVGMWYCMNEIDNPE
jgi:hypothetical protein